MFSGKCQVLIEGSKGAEILDCQWTIKSYTDGTEPEIGTALCLCLSPSDEQSTQEDCVRMQAARLAHVNGDGHEYRQSSNFGSFLTECVEMRAADPTIHCAFILPVQAGYVTRSDVFERRLVLSDVAETVRGFLKPLQRVETAINNEPGLRKLLESSVAGILLRSSAFAMGGFDLLLRELQDRLTFPWLSEQPISRKRLVWVGGRVSPSDSHETWSAAVALGVSLVLIDNSGHWLEDDSGPFAHYREAFVPMDMAADEGFVHRLLQTVQTLQKTMKIDGITVTTDARTGKVARVCKILGLPASPESAYDISIDKAKTRMLEPDAHPLCVFSDVKELQNKLHNEGLPKGLEYPLITKPCMGWRSDGVTRVTNEQELVEGATRASSLHANGPLHRTAFLVENYIDGPEFDANFVLRDGKVVFFEMADDFPKPGDRLGATPEADFGESEDITPSALPESERNIVRDTIHQSILRMGFNNGIFHCEGRLINSSMHHDFTGGGLGDLRPCSGEIKQQSKVVPSVYLHEINARTPAYPIVISTHFTYGVDYYALQQLFAVGEFGRASSLAHPFRNGAQVYLGVVTFPQERSGIMRTPDVFQRLVTNHSDMRDAIIASHTEIKGGQIVQGQASGELLILGWAIVASKKSREECLRLINQCRAKFEYELQ